MRYYENGDHLGFVVPLLGKNIFVINASNAVIFDMHLAESIPQGVTVILPYFKKCDL